MTFSLEALRAKIETFGPIPDDVLESICLPNPVRRHPSWMAERDAYCRRVADAGGTEEVLRYLVDDPPEHPGNVLMAVAPWGNNRVVTEAGYVESEPHVHLTPFSVEDTMKLQELVPSHASDVLRFLWLGDEEALARFGAAIPRERLRAWSIPGNSLAAGFDTLMRIFGAPFATDGALLDQVCDVGGVKRDRPSMGFAANLDAWLRRKHGLAPTACAEPSPTTREVMVTAHLLDAMFRVDEAAFPARAAALLDELHGYKFTRDDKTKFSLATRVVELLPWQRRVSWEAGDDKVTEVARLGGLLYEASGKRGGIPRLKCTTFATVAAADKAFDKVAAKKK